MSEDYPSNVPEWNTLRYLTADTINLAETTTLAIRLPVGFLPYFWGALSNLEEVYNWKQYGSLSEVDMVDIYNNEVVLVEFCDQVADCITNNEGVQDALAFSINFNPTINTAVQQQAGDVTSYYSAGTEVPTQFEDLDYVWGGLLGALAAWQDAVAECFLWLGVATDVRDAIIALPVFALPKPALVSAITAAFDIGIAASEAYLTATTTEEGFLCLIFDQICAMGSPYVLKDEYIVSAMENLGTYIPFVGNAGLLPGAYLNFEKFKALYNLASDTPNNDWMALCSCSPPNTYERDFRIEDPGFFDLGVASTYLVGQGVRSNTIGGNAQVILTWDEPVNLVSAQVTWIRPKNVPPGSGGNNMFINRLAPDGYLNIFNTGSTGTAGETVTEVDLTGWTVSSLDFVAAGSQPTVENKYGWLLAIRINWIGSGELI